MSSIALGRGDVVVGVNTHKDQHVAVAIDGLGGLVGEPKFIDASNDGYAELLEWAVALGDVHVFAVEGCGSYGIGLARFLRRHGHPPVEVSRPPRAGARRMSGKSDAIDAEHAARTALGGAGHRPLLEALPRPRALPTPTGHQLVDSIATTRASRVDRLDDL